MCVLPSVSAFVWLHIFKQPTKTYLSACLCVCLCACMCTFPHKLAIAISWGYPFILSIVKILQQGQIWSPQGWRTKGHHCMLLFNFKYPHTVWGWAEKFIGYDAMVDFDQMWSSFQHSLPCSPHTYSISVAALGFPWYRSSHPDTQKSSQLQIWPHHRSDTASQQSGIFCFVFFMLG